MRVQQGRYKSIIEKWIPFLYTNNKQLENAVSLGGHYAKWHKSDRERETLCGYT